jgi:hypothetical protein
MNCRLCDSRECGKIHHDRHRSYYRCASCGLLFVPTDEMVTLEEEKRRYDLHNNDARHEGYVGFLNEIVAVVAGHCGSTDRILDYGCGRGAVLAGLLRQKGFDCAAYDPLYNIGAAALSQSYDVIILCEVIEHVRDLKAGIAELKKVAGPKGTIVIRTQPCSSLENFGGWWYKNDLTHVNFFSPGVIDVLAARLGRKCVERKGEDIFVLHGT